MQLLEQLPITGCVGEQMQMAFLRRASVVPPKDFFQGPVAHEQFTLSLSSSRSRPGRADDKFTVAWIPGEVPPERTMTTYGVEPYAAARRGLVSRTHCASPKGRRGP